MRTSIPPLVRLAALACLGWLGVSAAPAREDPGGDPLIPARYRSFATSGAMRTTGSNGDSALELARLTIETNFIPFRAIPFRLDGLTAALRFRIRGDRSVCLLRLGEDPTRENNTFHLQIVWAAGGERANTLLLLAGGRSSGEGTARFQQFEAPFDPEPGRWYDLRYELTAGPHPSVRLFLDGEEVAVAPLTNPGVPNTADMEMPLVRFRRGNFLNGSRPFGLAFGLRNAGDTPPWPDGEAAGVDPEDDVLLQGDVDYAFLGIRRGLPSVPLETRPWEAAVVFDSGERADGRAFLFRDGTQVNRALIPIGSPAFLRPGGWREVYGDSRDAVLAEPLLAGDIAGLAAALEPAERGTGVTRVVHVGDSQETQSGAGNTYYAQFTNVLASRGMLAGTGVQAWVYGSNNPRSLGGTMHVLLGGGSEITAAEVPSIGDELPLGTTLRRFGHAPGLDIAGSGSMVLTPDSTMQQTANGGGEPYVAPEQAVQLLDPMTPKLLRVYARHASSAGAGGGAGALRVRTFTREGYDPDNAGAPGWTARETRVVSLDPADAELASATARWGVAEMVVDAVPGEPFVLFLFDAAEPGGTVDIWGAEVLDPAASGYVLAGAFAAGGVKANAMFGATGNARPLVGELLSLLEPDVVLMAATTNDAGTPGTRRDTLARTKLAFHERVREAVPGAQVVFRSEAGRNLWDVPGNELSSWISANLYPSDDVDVARAAGAGATSMNMRRLLDEAPVLWRPYRSQQEQSTPVAPSGLDLAPGVGTLVLDYLNDLVHYDTRLGGRAAAEATLTLFAEALAAAGACGPADIDADGAIAFGDASAFIAAFTAGDAAADVNGDGLLTFGDVSGFVAAFNAGCP